MFREIVVSPGVAKIVYGFTVSASRVGKNRAEAPWRRNPGPRKTRRKEAKVKPPSRPDDLRIAFRSIPLP